jgi:hypothetical protein
VRFSNVAQLPTVSLVQRVVFPGRPVGTKTWARPKLSGPGVSTDALSSVGRIEILLWSDWDDPGRVDIIVSVVVVPFDVIEIDGLSDSRLLVKVFQVTVKIRVVEDPPDIA